LEGKVKKKLYLLVALLLFVLAMGSQIGTAASRDPGSRERVSNESTRSRGVLVEEESGDVYLPIIGNGDGEHDTEVCHGALDGHTHGHCFEALPGGAIKDFLIENHEFQHVGHPWVSSEVENQFLYPPGKHEGMKMLYFDAAKDGVCHQFANTDDPSSGSCLKAIYLQVHSPGIGDESRTPGNVHSVTSIAEVCDRDGDGLGTQCGVVQVAEIENYGEIHSLYKKAGCPGVPGGLYYPSPYSVDDGDGNSSQPPYVATVSSRGNSHPNRLFWSSLRNAVMEQYVPANYLLQVAWVENAWSVPNTDRLLCADPANDIVTADSTDEGFINQYVIWTVRIDIEDYPRPHDGFTTRHGEPAPGCTAPGFDCLPIHIGADVPAGDVFFNLPVRNNDFSTAVEIIDITEPGVLRPGTHP
jgi:hypothetical protein